MYKTKNEYDQNNRLEQIFSPRSVAVVGVSEKNQNAGARFLKPFLKMGFKGDLYIINPEAKEAFNVRAYSKLTDIPGHIDHVIVCIPSNDTPLIIQQCVDKFVNTVAIYSAGFSESGTEEGDSLEKELLKIAGNSHLRIIGPNCMGIYCPDSGLSFRDDLPKDSGSVALISQSGGMAITSVLAAAERNIYFSKVVSYGNESDLRCSELLDYLSEDDETSMIMLYIEGTKDGRELSAALRKVCLNKPVVVLKGGITGAGTKAATSHTGALSGMAAIWSAVINQAGGIQAYSVEEFVDTALAFNYIKPPQGRNLGVVSISGGLGVNLSDLVVRMGFDIQTFEQGTQKKLGKFVNAPGTCVQNPVDLAITFMNIDSYRPIFSSLDEDDSVDIIIIHFCTEYLTRFKTITPNPSKFFVDAIAESLVSLKKPVVTVLPYTIRDDERKKAEKHFLEHKIPVWPTIERALISINHCMRYYRRRNES